jgi:hypothetical protein
MRESRSDSARTAKTGGLFASVLTFFFHTAITRMWQGVAAVPFGPSMFDRGTAGALVGLMTHICVAFGWSAIFYLIYERSAWIRQVIGTRFGVLKVASVYGPCIWLFMSLVVIPTLLHRPSNITIRWWIQLIGHIPFVAMPIVTQIGRDARSAESR